MKKFYLAIIFILILGGLFLFWFWHKSGTASDKEKQEPEETTFVKKIEVVEGSTYGSLMAEAEVATSSRQEIFQAAEEVYDLSNVRLGRTIDLIYDKATNQLQQLIYRIDSEEELYVTYQGDQTDEAGVVSEIWLAERIPINYEIKIKTAEGVIETSMYEAALDQGIDERAIIALADVFQWSVDFAMNVQKGDSFKFIYEERYRDGEYKMPGKILAGKFVNEGKNYYAFYYRESEDNDGYYDENADSVQRIFLKAPVAYKYISSGFTTGLRYIQSFDIATGHRAVDYAAEYGAPVRAVGDGAIVYAGWNGAYGNFISVRHNGTYTTNYAHLSKFAVGSGQKVTQGQTIGYVGSTGLSTGPHLHYEMVKYGTKINSMREVFPPNEAIAEENKADFYEKIKDWREELD